jgi:hypothetical protein
MCFFEPWRLDFFIEHSDDLVLGHTGTTDSYHQPPLCAKCLAYPAAFLTFIIKLTFLFFFLYFACYFDFAVPIWQRWHSCSDLKPKESILQFLYSFSICLSSVVNQV